MNKVGTKDLYYTYDTRPRPNGTYWVGRGTSWSWDLVKTFKSATAAQRYAVRMAGTETYND